MISDALTAIVACFQCREEIEGEPIRVKMDGRDYYLCCRSCEKLYSERYERINGAAR